MDRGPAFLSPSGIRKGKRLQEYRAHVARDTILVYHIDKSPLLRQHR
jgi:hypothetical protein